ncbi:MAG: hypothetical protein R2751_07725 [Bacteroidales bacterium]
MIFSFQAHYNMADKFLVEAGVYAVGARYFQNYDAATTAPCPW